MSFNIWCLFLWLGLVTPSPPDFDTEIMPRLTKLGCNAGACHGAAAGRGGLHLSLFGSEPNADYLALVREFEGRRVNLSQPRQSLLLRKPAGEIDHGGGQRFDWDDNDGQTLLRWLQAGAPRGASSPLVSLKIKPSSQLVAAIGQPVGLQVFAKFENDQETDVTDLVTWQNVDNSALSFNIIKTQVISQRAGQHFLIGRYLNQNLPVRITTPKAVEQINSQTERRNGPIDEHVLRVLDDLRLQVAPLTDDSTWFRRVSLDLTGRLPNSGDAQQFADSQDLDKRQRWVDQLLASEAYVEYWVWRWSKVLRMHSLPRDTQGFSTYEKWLREQIRNDVGWDQVARELLLSVGDTQTNGPANFHRMVNDARAEAELVTRAFAGIRLECANCHDHPLDRWTQADYHGLAAIFAPLERGTVIQWSPRNRITNPRTGEPATPKVPGQKEVANANDLRFVVADWLTHEDEMWLARATVNRLWQALFGRGLVNPVDDIRTTNPATHPELLEWLAEDFSTHGYRLKHTLRQIVMSQAYTRSSEPQTDAVLGAQFYAYYPTRSLPPEIFADAIADFLGVPAVELGNEVKRAVAVIDATQALPEIDRIGRCRLAATCSEYATLESGVAAELHLLNGSLINRRLMQQANQLDRWIDAQLSTAEFVEQAYWRGLGRAPRASEVSRWQVLLATDSPALQRSLWEDFLWGLINSREFRENH